MGLRCMASMWERLYGGGHAPRLSLDPVSIGERDGVLVLGTVLRMVRVCRIVCRMECGLGLEGEALRHLLLLLASLLSPHHGTLLPHVLWLLGTVVGELLMTGADSRLRRMGAAALTASPSPVVDRVGGPTVAGLPPVLCSPSTGTSPPMVRGVVVDVTGGVYAPIVPRLGRLVPSGLVVLSGGMGVVRIHLPSPSGGLDLLCPLRGLPAPVLVLLSTLGHLVPPMLGTYLHGLFL